MVTRIVMDKDILTPKKKFLNGQVYDSRFPLDMPAAADGVQHSIEQHLLDRFIQEGWAHEETWEEWQQRITNRRNAMLSTASVVDPLPNPAMSGFNAGREARRVVNTGMSCQIIED